MYNTKSHLKEYIISQKKTQITVRISVEKKAEFERALKKNDAISSNVLRRFIDEYIEKNK